MNEATIVRVKNEYNDRSVKNPTNKKLVAIIVIVKLIRLRPKGVKENKSTKKPVTKDQNNAVFKSPKTKINSKTIIIKFKLLRYPGKPLTNPS